MGNQLFNVILKSIAIPIVAIWLLQRSFLGEQGAWLAVLITLTIVNILSFIFQVIKILGNTLLFRGKRVLTLMLVMVIEIGSVIGFWITYYNKF